MILNEQEKLFSSSATGKFGYSGGFGMLTFSYNRFGFYSAFSGIYQRKKTLKGFKYSRMRFYRPTNPRTTIQQSWRGLMAPGWSVYRGLTTDELRILSIRAKRYGLAPQHLFMRYWLQQHR